MKHILSFSGGKDSTYLAIYLVENSYPLDEAVMFDTGWEFPQMYKHIEKMRAYLENHNVELTVLKPKRSFDYLMTEKLVKERNGGGCHYGYSWCGLKGCRWGTTEKNRSSRRILTEKRRSYCVYRNSSRRARTTRKRAQTF